MARENDTRTYDHLTASVSKYLVAIASLTVVYTFITLSQMDRVEGRAALVGLDKLLAMREPALAEQSC